MTDKEKSIKQDKTRAKDWTFIVYQKVRQRIGVVF